MSANAAADGDLGLTGHRLDDRHIVITGASQGLGLAMARALQACGARVTAIARSAERLAAAAMVLSVPFIDPASLIVPLDVVQPMRTRP
jgi:NAD(P)-dependent dehydrogenase (short-subunit alcohol dehydrogenase family)